MAITDLTNTTWTFGTITASSGYGKFSVNGTAEGQETPFTQICIGYTFTGSITSATNSAITADVYDYPISTLENGATITITGGDDVTNTSLISWLEANGELQEEPSTTDTVTITYGDKTITLSAGQKCTFKGGKVMQDDIVAVVSASEEVTLISFTVDSTEYKAVEGMTWTEWCDSEYNTGGYYIDGNFVRPMVGIVVTNANSNVVSPSSTIINGYAYGRMAAGGAD